MKTHSRVPRDTKNFAADRKDALVACERARAETGGVDDDAGKLVERRELTLLAGAAAVGEARDEIRQVRSGVGYRQAKGVAGTDVFRKLVVVEKAKITRVIAPPRLAHRPPKMFRSP